MASWSYCIISLAFGAGDYLFDGYVLLYYSQGLYKLLTPQRRALCILKASKKLPFLKTAAVHLFSLAVVALRAAVHRPPQFTPPNIY